MDLSLFDMLRLCQPGHEQLHFFTLFLSGLASLAAVIAAAYRLWRWRVGPLRTHRVAARALRMEGTYHAKLNHGVHAMQLYDYSIRLNPRAAHVYYLRGNLHEGIGNIDRAIADWRRCLARYQGIETRHITSLGIVPIYQSSFLGPRRWARSPVCCCCPLPDGSAF